MTEIDMGVILDRNLFEISLTNSKFNKKEEKEL